MLYLLVLPLYVIQSCYLSLSTRPPTVLTAIESRGGLNSSCIPSVIQSPIVVRLVCLFVKLSYAVAVLAT